MFTIEQKRKFTQEFRIEEGWIISINNIPPIPDNLEDEYRPEDVLIFTAINILKGKDISVYYENNEIGYTLYYSKLGRKDGKWDLTDETNKESFIVSDRDISLITTKIQAFLNPTEKNITLLKTSGWSISINNLLDSIDEYSDSEFLFFATESGGKFFIDVSFIKDNDTPYKICLGRNKHKLSGINYSVHHPVELKNIELATLNEVIDLIENYTLLTEEYFKKLMKQ